MKKSFLIAIMQKGQLKSTDSFEYIESSNIVILVLTQKSADSEHMKLDIRKTTQQQVA